MPSSPPSRGGTRGNDLATPPVLRLADGFAAESGPECRPVAAHRGAVSGGCSRSLPPEPRVLGGRDGAGREGVRLAAKLARGGDRAAMRRDRATLRP